MKQDMTTGSPLRHIIMFTLPLFVGTLFQQFYSMADTLIVGRIVGMNALAAVGCTGSLTFLMIGCAQGMTAGFTIVTTQRVGARDENGVRKSFAISIVLSVIVTVVLTLLGAFASRSLLELLKTPPAILDEATIYLQIVMLGSATMMIFNLLSNLFRALGDSRTPLYYLVVACIINIALDILFIGPMKMGVAGAAYATVIAQLVSGVLCVFTLLKNFPSLRLKKEDFKFDRSELYTHLRMGLPMGFQSSIIAIGTLALQFALNNLGELAVASFTAANKVDNIGTMPLSSIGLAMATYAGQNYGAQKFDRVKKGIIQASILTAVLSLTSGLCMVVFGRSLAAVFVGDEPQVIELAAQMLAITGIFHWALGFLFLFRSTLQGLGKSLAPTVAGIMELIMRCIASIVLAQMFGFVGACWAGPLAWIGSLIVLTMSLISFFRMNKNNLQLQA